MPPVSPPLWACYYAVSPLVCQGRRPHSVEPCRSSLPRPPEPTTGPLEQILGCHVPGPPHGCPLPPFGVRLSPPRPTSCRGPRPTPLSSPPAPLGRPRPPHVYHPQILSWWPCSLLSRACHAPQSRPTWLLCSVGQARRAETRRRYGPVPPPRRLPLVSAPISPLPLPNSGAATSSGPHPISVPCPTTPPFRSSVSAVNLAYFPLTFISPPRLAVTASTPNGSAPSVPRLPPLGTLSMSFSTATPSLLSQLPSSPPSRPSSLPTPCPSPLSTLMPFSPSSLLLIPPPTSLVVTASPGSVRLSRSLPPLPWPWPTDSPLTRLDVSPVACIPYVRSRSRLDLPLHWPRSLCLTSPRFEPPRPQRPLTCFLCSWLFSSAVSPSCSPCLGRTGALGCGGSASGLPLTIGTGSLT